MLVLDLTQGSAAEFVDRCRFFGAVTMEQKLMILADMAEEGLITRAYLTDRTPEQLAKDMAKNFGTTPVLHVKAKRKKKRETNN